MKVCIVGASGKLGQYMVQHSLDLGHEVVGVCRPESVHKLDHFGEQIEVFPGRTDDRAVIERAVKGCQGVLTVLAPWGYTNYSSKTAQAVMDFAEPDARLIYSCGWHITRDGKDVYSFKLNFIIKLFTFIAWVTRMADISDQVRACDNIMASDTRWTVVRGCDLEEGESEGLPVWSQHVGDPILESNLVRRTDFALFMVAAVTDDALVRECPAINGCQSESALRHAPAGPALRLAA